MACEPDETRHLECREGSNDVCAYPQAQALGRCDRDPIILVSDE